MPALRRRSAQPTSARAHVACRQKFSHRDPQTQTKMLRPKCCQSNQPLLCIYCTCAGASKRQNVTIFQSLPKPPQSSDCDPSVRCNSMSQPKTHVTNMLQFIEARVRTRAKQIDILVDADDGTAKMLNSSGNTSLTLGHKTKSKKTAPPMISV